MTRRTLQSTAGVSRQQCPPGGGLVLGPSLKLLHAREASAPPDGRAAGSLQPPLGRLGLSLSTILTCLPKAAAVHTWNTGAKLVWKFRYQVVIDPVFHRSQNNHGPCVTD